MDNEFQRVHEVGLADGNQMKIEEEAGVQMASHLADQMRGKDALLFDHFDRDKFKEELQNINLELSFANSDHDHYQKDVNRRNLIKLFLEGNEIDKYITTHLYGEIQKMNDNDESINESFVNGSFSQAQFDMTFLK